MKRLLATLVVGCLLNAAPVRAEWPHFRSFDDEPIRASEKIQTFQEVTRDEWHRSDAEVGCLPTYGRWHQRIRGFGAGLSSFGYGKLELIEDDCCESTGDSPHDEELPGKAQSLPETAPTPADKSARTKARYGF